MTMPDNRPLEHGEFTLKTAFATLPKYFAVLALCWSSMAAAQTQTQLQTAAPQSRIATFSPARIYAESQLVKRAEEKLLQEFKSRESALNDLAARLKATNDSLTKDLSSLSESERARRQKEGFDLDKEFQRRTREFQEDLNQRRNEERAVVAEKASNIIRKMAEEDGFDVVLQEPFWFNPRIDITDKVIAALDK
jgi:outer membrane protein